MFENVLVVIPARGGSKGIPHKNIKPLGGKPLICYSIDVARQITSDENICVTTDDDEIIKVVEDYGLKVPFKRPAELATDNCGSNEVILHALKFFEDKGKNVERIILLQPTSPFRTKADVVGCYERYKDSLDMVTTVKEASSNPYYDCYELNEEGYLQISKGDGTICRRQDAPKVYEYNGAVYVINPKALKEKGLAGMTKVSMFEMDDFHSIDLDTMFDWKIAELVLKEGLV